MIRKVILLVFLINPLVSYAQVDSTENIITFRVISIVGASSEDPGTSVPFD